MTITTVGYGDFYPVTTGGRITAFFVMFAGVGIIGALASILASILVSPASTEADGDAAPTVPEEHASSILQELQAIRAELEAMRTSLGAGVDVAPSVSALASPDTQTEPE